MQESLDSMRTYTLTLARRAAKDIRDDGFRQLRGYVDMAAALSRGPGHKYFFGAAQKALERADSIYYPLLQKALENVDSSRACLLGVNIGIDSFTYGAKQLREEKQRTGAAAPWMVLFESAKPQAEPQSDATAPGAAGPQGAQASTAQEEASVAREEASTAGEKASVAREEASTARGEARAARVEQGEALGTFLYGLACESAREVDAAACLASGHEKSTFFARMTPVLAAKTASVLENTPNLVPVLRLSSLAVNDDAERACALLREKKLFYILDVCAGAQELPTLFSETYLELLAQNTLVCLCENAHPEDRVAARQLQKGVYRSRTQQDVPVLLLDWDADTCRVSKYMQAEVQRA